MTTQRLHTDTIKVREYDLRLQSQKGIVDGNCSELQKKNLVPDKHREGNFRREGSGLLLVFDREDFTFFVP